MTRPPLASAALAALVLALGAGTTSAATHTYDVTVDTTFTYDHTQHSESHSATRHNVSDHALKLSGRLLGRLPMVQFVDGQIRPSDNGIVEEQVTGTSTSFEDDSWSGVTRLSCTADGKPSPWGRTRVEPAGLAGELVALRITDLLEVNANCDDGRSPGFTIARLDGDSDDPVGGPFDDVFEIPRIALGDGKIVQLLEGGVEGEFCPGHDERTTRCKLAWQSTVSFVRSDLADQVPPAQQHVPAKGTDDDLGSRASDAIRAELERRRREEAAAQAKVDALSKAIKDYLDLERIADTISKVLTGGNAPQANLNLTCPGACTGTVTATAGGATLARGTIRPAAKSAAAKTKGAYRATVKLKFDRADRKRARRTGKVKLAFAVRVGAGKAQRVTTTVKLGGARKRR